MVDGRVVNDRAQDARELLNREIAVLWGTDDCGRFEPPPLLSVAVPGDGTDDEPPDTFPREGVGPAERVELRSCRSFVIDRPLARSVARSVARPAARSGLDGAGLIDSDESGAGARLGRLRRPEAQWPVEEWQTLMSGTWGPFAAAVDSDGVVLALCFTPRLGGSAAEAGVWTHPEHRGRGLAGAVTARWADLISRRCDAVFYSARPDNAASLAVARRLGARPIGTIWQLWSVPDLGSGPGSGDSSGDDSGHDQAVIVPDAGSKGVK